MPNFFHSKTQNKRFGKFKMGASGKQPQSNNLPET